MPRTCFVIMPFSATASCNKQEWTWIFENVFKPAVEDAGLNYECRRSAATRGNIVASILQELSDAYVVLADLTDRNTNVFYELGVRHTLKDRTILVAQKKEDIPFDLLAYAYHVYDWKTEKGRAELTEKLAQLLSEIDTSPERPDNPVSDFLRRTPEPVTAPPLTAVTPIEVSYAQSLAGSSAEGLDAVVFARQLAHMGAPQVANTVFKLTHAELQPLIQQKVYELNQREVPDRIQEKEVPQLAQEFISAVEPLVRQVEQFVVATVEEDWQSGALLGLRFAGKWISITELPRDGRSIRPAQGTPALLAWRMLLLSGAKALAEEAFDILGIILREPIEVERVGGVFSNRSLIQRHDLFYPEAFFGHADQAINYIASLWGRETYLQGFFTTKEEYHFEIAKFLMVVALAAPPDEFGHVLYPGYAWFPEAHRAMSQLRSRLSASQSYLEGVSRAIGETGSKLRESWAERVTTLNTLVSESEHRSRGVKFPASMDE
jgi:hypothetical protein